MNKHEQERGIASILTVLFFTLIISVISIGFLRISLQEGSETLDNDLSKSAFAAAYSGVNDAKRAIIYCVKSPGAAGCDQLNTNTCPGFIANASLRTALSINPDAQGSVIVGDPTLNQRYTCTTITTDTTDVSGSLQLNQDSNSVLVPLTGTLPYASVRISWHKAGAAVDPPDTSIAGNPRISTAVGGTTWAAAWPALLRASVIQHPSTGITIDTSATGVSNISENTFFFYPLASVAAPTTLTAPLSGVATRQNITCRNPAGGFTVEDALYACQVIVPVDSTAGPAYLHLSNIYKDTDYAVELLDGAGNVVTFDDVSPLIDSTGSAGNVYRRVKVRVAFDGGGYGGRNPILPNAIDVGGTICKNFRVTNDANDFTEDCTP